MSDARLKDQAHNRGLSSNPPREISELFLDDGSSRVKTLLNPTCVGKAVRDGLLALATGKAYGAKAVLQPSDEEIFPLIGTERLDLRFLEERLNWKLNALVSVNERYGAVKIVGSNAHNRTLGLPRSRSIVVLYDKLTMQPISILEGTAISNCRTGAYASIVADLTLGRKVRFNVFLFGAGCVAEAIIDDLNAHHGQRIGRVFVKSRCFESAEAFATRVAGRVGFPLQAVDDHEHLPNADFVITASNARNPVFSGDEIGAGAVVLHLGGDEAPASFIRQALESGTVLCDDVETVCHRNSQSLALYFSRQGMHLSEAASAYRIGNLWEALQKRPGCTELPAFITCVGLPVLDLYVAQWIYESILAERSAYACPCMESLSPPVRCREEPGP